LLITKRYTNRHFTYGHTDTQMDVANLHIALAMPRTKCNNKNKQNEINVKLVITKILTQTFLT